MSTLGPKFMMRCQAPQEWNRQLAADSSATTEVFVEDAAGQGWQVEIYSETLKKKLLNAELPLVTYVAHIIREDAELLYLFESRAERSIFEALHAIKGINVNVAATSVAVVGPALLLQWLQGASAKGYKFTGLGPKTIEKLIYEMQSKKNRFLPLLQAALSDEGALATSASSAGGNAGRVSPNILLGLEKLGLRPSDTLRIIEEMRTREPDVAELSDQALIAKILQSWGREKWSLQSSHAQSKETP